jgi:hypothetical protein
MAQRKGKLANASTSQYAPLHGLWEVRIRDPAYANPPVLADQRSEVAQKI